MSVSSIIQSMISKCNTVTGNSDTNLTAGIQSLVDGFGGGMPTGFKAIAQGTHTLSSAVAGGSTFNVTHNLGEIPDLFIFYAPSNIATSYSMLYAQRGNFYWRSSSYIGICGYHGNSTTSVNMANVMDSYGVKAVTASTATITTYSTSTSYYWRAGTYKWIAIKFS